MIVTRFAPSPTGHLHLGHAYSAMLAYRCAQQAHGRFLLRIEDIDPVRCKPEFAKDLMEDLRWLGLRWEEPVRRQSEHMDDYTSVLDQLRERGLVYPCFCTRREVAAEAMASGHAPHLPIQSLETVVYAGTCRDLSCEERKERLRQGPANWRLDVAKSMALVKNLFWHDRIKGKIEARPQDFGDIVLARKDIPTSYHLSVSVDDSIQGVTFVTRGEDLFRATDIHCLLQKLLGYDTPEYYHHHLQCDANGKRYAKRDQSVTLRSLREKGKSAAEIQAMAGFSI